MAWFIKRKKKVPLLSVNYPLAIVRNQLGSAVLRVFSFHRYVKNDIVGFEHKMLATIVNRIAIFVIFV